MSVGPCRRVFEYGKEALSVLCNLHQAHSLDDFLQVLWNQAMSQELFRYHLKALETKILPGKYQFVAQLNPERALKRRKPQFITDVAQPFNENDFNFENISPSEVLFELRPTCREPCNKNERSNEKFRNLVVINVSPLEYCNCLIVPDVCSRHPQVMTAEALRLVIETMLLSRDPDLRVGFNSLGGYASVNHLHFHMYYLKQRLYLETSLVKPLANCLYMISDYPAEGFAFEVVDSDITDVVTKVMVLISFLLEKKIAHNMFLTRGHQMYHHENEVNGYSILEPQAYNAIRIFIWARKFSLGAKDDFAFNPALCELAGHLPIKTKEFYDNITEHEVAKVLSEECHDVFMSVIEDVKQLFSS